jgi:cardiolipin synthase
LWCAFAALAFIYGERGAAVGAVIGGLLAYLLVPREQPPAFGLDHKIDIDSPEYLPSLVGLTGTEFIGGNRVTLLNNGDEFYPAMLDAIRSARASVTIEAYIYWQGEIGMEFARALSERSQAGCAVKILLDAVGSSTIGNEILKTLEQGGCQLAWFNPIHWFSFGRFNYRTHRKSLIVDGRIGFTGGAGIADQGRGRAQDEEHWRDMQIRVEGPGVVPLQTGFAQNWLQTTRELISGPRFFPVEETEGRIPVHTMLSSPTSGASEARLLYLFAIVCSRRSILIANPYFVPDPAAIDTLVDACRRGVKVTVVVSGRHNDNWLARNNSVRLFGRLLKCGVEIYEYNKTMLHQKAMIVDGGFATIGTANFDNRSFAFNEESSVSFVDRTLVRSLEATFQEDIAISRRLTLDIWQRRGILARVQEFIAAFMEDQV